MGLEQISLGQFVENVISVLSQRKIKIPTEDRSWHELFYDLHKEDRKGKPLCIEKMRFDWNGPYPESPELSEALSAHAMAFGVNICSMSMIVDESYAKTRIAMQKGFPKRLGSYLNYAALGFERRFKQKNGNMTPRESQQFL
jgi:hypothetical protein